MAKNHVCPVLKESRVHVINTGGIIGKEKNEDDEYEAVDGGLHQRLRENPNYHDKSYKLRFVRGENEPLVLPQISSNPYRVVYDIVDYAPEIDSSSVTVKDWERIARDVGVRIISTECYESYDGFVILHGSDTLAFTASGLGFLFENLGKPVVVTGAKTPISEVRSDGSENFIGALMVAGNCNVPEVLLFISNKIFRGCRSTKKSTKSFNLFESPNMNALGTVGTTVEIDIRQIFRPCELAPFSYSSKMEPNIGLVRMYPGITAKVMRTFLSEPMKGLVIQSYGDGNIPLADSELVDAIREAAEREVLIVNITQCPYGHITNINRDSTWMELGVASGHDMTQEAAFAKLSYVLGKANWDFSKKFEMMEINLRGEITVPKIHDIDLIEGVARSLNLSKTIESDHMCATFFPALIESAIRNDDANKLMGLKQCGANLSDTNTDGRTALHLACFLGKKNCIQTLLCAGCPVDLTDRFNRTPLHEAIDTDNHEVIKILLKSGAVLTDEPGELADHLRIFAEHGRTDRLESYRLAGANLEVTDAAGHTALHHASQMGQANVVKYLLPYYKNPSIKDALGLTPIQYAKAGNHNNIVCMLCADKMS